MLEGVGSVLEIPTVAAVCGAMVGIGIGSAPLIATRYLDSENPWSGVTAGMVATMLGLLLGFGLLGAFWFVAKATFAWFGIALVAGFVAAIGLVAWKLQGLFGAQHGGGS